MTRRQHFIVILILGALSTISPFSIDMYLPGFPAIARDLHTEVARVQLSLTSYFVGISVGQLIYGPLLDRFGRKAPLYAGMSIYVLTSLGCIFVHSVNELIVMRFIQALGGCVSLVASRALVRDLFPVSESAKIFSTLMLVLAVSPMLAPTVGGYVATAFNWHSIFIILAVIGFGILTASYFYLPEGKRPDPTMSLKPLPIIKNFSAVFKEPQFLTYAITGSLSSSVVYAYISGSPDVFMDIYKVNARSYGWIFAFIAVAIIGSSQLNRVFLKWYKSEQLIKAALIAQFFLGIFLIAGILMNWLGLYGLVGTLFLFMCGQGFTFPNASALSLAPFTRLSGTASALMGALQLGIGSIASALVSIFHSTSALPMVFGITACSISSLAFLYISKLWMTNYRERLLQQTSGIL